MKRKAVKKQNNRKIQRVNKKSLNEKEVSLLDTDLKKLVTIIKPTRNSKIYEKFE